MWLNPLIGRRCTSPPISFLFRIAIIFQWTFFTPLSSGALNTQRDVSKGSVSRLHLCEIARDAVTEYLDGLIWHKIYAKQWIIWREWSKELSNSDKRSLEHDFSEIYCFSFYGRYHFGSNDSTNCGRTESTICECSSSDSRPNFGSRVFRNFHNWQEMYGWKAGRKLVSENTNSTVTKRQISVFTQPH